MAYVTVDVELDEFDDDELVEEVKARGYTVVEEEEVKKFEMEDWKLCKRFVSIIFFNSV